MLYRTNTVARSGRSPASLLWRDGDRRANRIRRAHSPGSSLPPLLTGVRTHSGQLKGHAARGRIHNESASVDLCFHSGTYDARPGPIEQRLSWLLAAAREAC